MTVAVRGAGAVLTLQALWIAVGGVVLPLLLELAAFEEEACAIGCVSGWLFALGNVAPALVVAVAGIKLVTGGAGNSETSGWLSIAGVANLFLAALWAVFAGTSSDVSSVIPFLIVFLVVAVLTLGLARVTRVSANARET